MRFSVTLVFVLAAIMLIAGCAQQEVKVNETGVKNETTPPIVPAPEPQPPSVNTSGNKTIDEEDMFSDDLDKALDDIDAVTDPSELVETSELTQCSSDEDCWCRNFDGAKFLPGKTTSPCNSGMCQKCYYR